jgi:3-deoxy-D-manno-octulosonic-acid transferase
MPSTPPAYRCLTALASALLPLAARAGGKIRQGHAGRLAAPEALRRWAAAHRRRDRPLVWFHASSVGEGLQAESVLRSLRALRPDAQYVYTHFGPSAEPLARRVPADVAGYVPYDRPAAVAAALDALTPDLLVFSKLDLWPELATSAAARGVTVAMVAATVSPGSGRLGWPARALLRAGYAAVEAAGAIAEDDAERLARLGVRRERIRVLGDPRYDSVVERIRAVLPDDPLLRLARGGPAVLVAGSTWPPDEAVLLDAVAAVRRAHPEARLILVPHEPTAAHLAAVERQAARAGAPPPVHLSAAEGPAPLLVVDRVGVLAALYGAGTMAYVGGGFGRAGLHSVLEPVAWGVPVAFGPRWRESRDAGLLLAAGAAAVVTDGTTLGRCWLRWIEEEGRREAQGLRAKAVVDDGRGAARRSAELLTELIGSRPLRTSPTAAPPVPR